MPRGDRSGPMGMGPMPGRAAGLCAGYPAPGYATPLPDRSAFGRGVRGGAGGRGHRNRYYATGLTGWQRATAGWLPAQPGSAPYPYQAPVGPASADEELRMIRSRIEMMEQNIKAARDRLEEMESQQDQSPNPKAGEFSPADT